MSDYFVLNWKIINISMCILNKGEVLFSPWILVEGFHRSKWRFQFCPDGMQGREFPCFLCRAVEDEGPYELEVSGDIGIVDADGLFRKADDPFRNITIGHGRDEGMNQFMKKERFLNQLNLFAPNDTLTIRCVIRSPCSKMFHPTIYKAVTDILTDKHSIDIGFNGECIEKKLNPTKTKSEVSIIFRKSLHGIEFEVDVRKQIYALKYDIVLLDKNKVPTTFRTRLNVGAKLFYTNRHIIYPNLYERAAFESNGVLTFQCKIDISDGKTESCIEIDSKKTPRTQFPDKILIDSGLREDFQGLYLEPKFSDVQLKAGERIYPVHKSILVSRSPVFQTMFEQDMVENKSGVVDISDVEPDTLNALLLYMYSGIMEDLNFESVLKLYMAADKYMVW